MKKLLVAALMVVLASPAFAAIQNVKVSGDITTTWVDRHDFDFGMNCGALGTCGSVVGLNHPVGLKSQNVFITQTRLRVDADLSDNVSTTVGLLNERAWTSEATRSSGTSVDIYLASVTMRELLYSPLTVTVGRQDFNYGNGLIIGSGGPNNGANAGDLKDIAGDLTMRTYYDGVKAVLDYKPLTIDMFYFKNDQTVSSLQGLGHLTSGQSSDVYGINANYQLSDHWNSILEAYLFSRINGAAYTGVANLSGSTAMKGDKLYVPGLRASTNPIKGLNVQGEIAWQFGSQEVADGSTGAVESERRSAMALQLMASYALPVLEKYKPSVNGSFTYVSGDKNSNRNYSGDSVKSAKVYRAWDEFNKNQGSGTIYSTIFPLTDMYIYSVGASVNPLEDVTVGATWSNLIAAESYSSNNLLSVVQPNGTAGGSYTFPLKTNENGLGNEFDVNLNYAYTEDVNFGVSLGWFLPGDAFVKGNRSVANQALASLGVKF